MQYVFNKVEEGEKRTKIIVQSLEKKSDIQQLLTALKSDKFLEISFLNLQIIPKSIVIALNKIKKRISLFTNEATLKGYLMNLGFDLNYQNSYRNKKLKTLHLECIVMGGSAGSLKRIIDVIQVLPKSDISLFVVIHQKADKTSKLCHFPFPYYLIPICSLVII